MSLPSLSFPGEKQATKHSLLPLWSAGFVLFAFTYLGTLQGSDTLFLALIVASLVGVLILIRPEFGVIVLTSTFFLSYPEALQGSGRFTINNLLGIVLVGLLLIRVALEKRAEFLHSQQVQLFLLVGGIFFINHWLTDQKPPLANLAELDLTEQRVHDLVTRLMFLTFFVSFIRTRWQILLLTSTVVFFILMTAPNAIENALTAVGGTEETRASADFGVVLARNANRLAFFSAVAIALIGHAILEFRSRTVVACGGLAIALLVVTIFLSASRSGLLNLIFLSVTFVSRVGLRSGKSIVLLFALLIAVGISLTVVPQVHLDRITNFFLSEPREEGAGSTEARLGLLEVGFRMFKDHPLLGVGVGDFRWVSVVEYQNSRFSALHNSYLLTLVEGGLVLFLAYVALFWQTWKGLQFTQRLSTQMPSIGLGWLVEALKTILILFLIFSFFADFWHEVFLYIIIGLSATVMRLYQNTAGPDRQNVAGPDLA